MIDLILGEIILILVMIGAQVVLMIAIVLTTMMIMTDVIAVTAAIDLGRQAITFQSKKINLSNKELNSIDMALERVPF